MTRGQRRAAHLLMTALFLAALAGAATAQPPTGTDLESATRELASGMRCPVCQGVSIHDSPTELAREMKGVIRQQLAEGRTPEEVKAYFVARYGEWVLLEPEARGFNLIVYLLPVAGMLVGAALVVRVVKRWTHMPPPDPTLARLTTDDLEAEAP